MNQSSIADLGEVIAAVTAAGLFSSVCTINRLSGSPDSLGQVNHSAWAPVTGLTSIPCMKSPLIEKFPLGKYVERLPGAITEQNEYHVLLNGIYTGILQSDQAVIDGEPLDVRNVEHDSQRITTRLAVRRYAA